MRFEIEDHHPVTIMRLDGEMRLQDSRRFEEALRESVFGQHRQILLDMENCRFIDSKTMLIILKYHREALAGGGIIKILKPAKSVRKFFQTANIEGLFEIFTNQAEALASFRQIRHSLLSPPDVERGKERRKHLWRVALDQRCTVGMLITILQYRGVLEESEAETVLGGLLETN